MKCVIWFIRSAAERILIAALAGMLLLYGVFLLPTQPMQQHMERSAQLLMDDAYPQLFPWCTSQLDNYTDALMLMHASNQSGETAIRRAVLIYSNQMEDAETPVDSLRMHYQDGLDYDTTQTYAHYWHGYLLLLKPLLLVMDLQGIRIANAAVQLLLVAVIVYLLIRKKTPELIVPFLLTYGFLMPYALAMSLQFSTCFYLLCAGSIGVLLMRETEAKRGAILFLWLGIGTAYFDYLTYPLAVFGIPAVFYCYRRGEMTAGDTLKEGAVLLLSWCVGYVGMWAGKWVLGSVLVSQNILQMGMDKVVERSVLNDSMLRGLVLHIRMSVNSNVKAFFRTPVTFALLAEVAEYAVIWLRGKKPGFQKCIRCWLPFVILALLPIGWYLAATNHSIIHYWFTNKTLSVSVFSVQCAFWSGRKEKT